MVTDEVIVVLQIRRMVLLMLWIKPDLMTFAKGVTSVICHLRAGGEKVSSAIIDKGGEFAHGSLILSSSWLCRCDRKYSNFDEENLVSRTKMR